MIESLLSSNIVQLFLTASTGAGIYLAWRMGLKVVLPLVGYVLSVGVIVGAITGFGETYVYSDYYRRSFFFYGDIIPLAVGFVFLFAVASRRDVLAVLAATACLFASGKAAMVITLVMAGVMVWLHWSRTPSLLPRLARLGALGGALYALCIAVVLLADLSPDRLLVRVADLIDATSADSAAPADETSTGKWSREFAKSLREYGQGANHRGACATIQKCYDNMLASAWYQRYYSSAAGLWMMWQGGFHGDDYPGSADEFADLMIRVNPFGLNDKYDLERWDWYRMGNVQNPYLAFGAGYGPIMLLGLICVFAIFWFMAASNLVRGESDIGAVFSVFYLVAIPLNQTQSWLQSWSVILVLVGFCAMHILLEFLRRRGKLPGAIARRVEGPWERDPIL